MKLALTAPVPPGCALFRDIRAWCCRALPSYLHPSFSDCPELPDWGRLATQARRFAKCEHYGAGNPVRDILRSLVQPKPLHWLPTELPAPLRVREPLAAWPRGGGAIGVRG